ncbi:uncharacterized protein KQ657_001910 [Scheffersomyces spartinae]|uniref:Uncharacterized protein n=1 Tax=Scheffersomyces spartinae TaxID=45513 RepID=A0A9P8AHI9_9ASCO|nr:uncharacterized protein KQ657_001910 [Scheffersomyces spartinae]KAG7192194.1 hypothetical protein KQ657_001910 [Scheffersomyces spartinae]
MIATHKRKQYTETPFEYNHKTSTPHVSLQRLTFDPPSYFVWFESVCAFVKDDHNICTMLVLSHYSKNIDNDEEYLHEVSQSIKACEANLKLNAYINETLLRSVDPQLGLSVGVSTMESASENFERLKSYFSGRISAFYYLNLESQLKFDINNVLQFLKDIDCLSRVYSFAFRGDAQMTPELKLQWIMNSLRGNQEILLDIQNDWENIIKNPMLLRSILTKHLNKAKRVRRALMDV